MKCTTGNSNPETNSFQIAEKKREKQKPYISPDM